MEMHRVKPGRSVVNQAAYRTALLKYIERMGCTPMGIHMRAVIITFAVH